MILGIGSDLIDIRRIQRSIERHGERFLARVYTDVERTRADSRGARYASYAKRFAAKEACAKALGTGFRQGVAWRDMEVDSLASGKPFLRLGGGAARRLSSLTPPGMQAAIDLSLTDEYPFAHAIVVIWVVAAG